MVYSSGDSGYHAPTLASRLTPAAAAAAAAGSCQPPVPAYLQADSSVSQQEQHQQHFRRALQAQSSSEASHHLHQGPPQHQHQQQPHHYQQRLPVSYLGGQTSSSVLDSGEGSSSLGLQPYRRRQQAPSLPRLGYLFSQNPAISASLPNYAETRALMGSQLIDSGSLDYSIEEPLSLPAAVGSPHPTSQSAAHYHHQAHQPASSLSYHHHHRQHHHRHHHQHQQHLAAQHQHQQQQHQQQHHHYQQRLAQMRQQPPSQPPSLAGRDSYYPSSSASAGTWTQSGGRLGSALSGATTAEPLPSSSVASFYRSSPGSSVQQPPTGYLSRHSALPSLERPPAGLGRQRPVFQKSSSTPSRGASHRQHSMSPPPPLPPPLPAHLQPHHPHPPQLVQQHRLPVDPTTGYMAAASLPADLPTATGAHHRLRQPSLGYMTGSADYERDYSLLPAMLDEAAQLGGRPGRLASDPIQLQHQQRRLLPRIPRPLSPSDFAAVPMDDPMRHQLHQDAHEQQRDAYALGDEAELARARHQRRRRSSLELERQQHRALGLAPLDDYYPAAYAPPMQLGLPAPPRISVSPEPDGYSPPHQFGAHHQRRPSMMASSGPLGDHYHQYQQQQRQIVGPSQTPPRSMAMGSDSELNTRGISASKLYYVHVPPARRPRPHQSSARRQPPPPPPPHPGDQFGGEPVIQHHQPMQPPPQPQPQQQQLHLHQSGAIAQEFLPPEPRPRAEYSGSRRPAPPPPPDLAARSFNAGEQQPRAPPSKGVTFDGRTSAPVYGRRRPGEGRREPHYLRTNSDEPYGEQVCLPPGAEHHRPAPVVVAFEEQGVAASEPGADDYTGYNPDEAENRSPGSQASRGSQTLGASPQHQQASPAKQSSGEQQVSGGERDSWTSQLEAAAGSQERRASRLSGLEPAASTSQLATRQSRERRQHLAGAKYGEGSSLSDTEGGASKRLGGRGTAGKLTGAPTPSSQQATGETSRRERRARVRDRDREQQSSNERSTEAAGSSQSLKSQTGQTTGAGLSKKSNSTTQLSSTGTKKRIGFRKKQVTLFSVHRSEEVVPHTALRHLVKQTTSVSDEGLNEGFSGEHNEQLGSSSLANQPGAVEPDSPFSFVDGLGAGQIISRQALASPCLGHIQLSLTDNNGALQVEVIRARDLQLKPHAKTLPSPYVKAYLMRNRKCIAKLKTDLARKTLDPLYQQTLHFHEDYSQCILQIIVWGDYGRMQHKILMGIVQVQLDDLDLSSIVIGWYKLFNPSCMTSMPSKSLRQSMLSTSTQSFT